MAAGPSVAFARIFLDMLSDDVDVRLWTVAPAFDGTGGTEVTGGGYAPAVLTTGAAVAGTGGQIAKKPSSTPLLFANMPVASTGVHAISVHVHSTGEMRWLLDSWTPPSSWAVGESPQFPLSVAIVPVA